MKFMRQGVLLYDSSIERFTIRFDLTNYSGGLHCGECFDVWINRKWIPTRIEFGDDWYLVGIDTLALNGLLVRI